MDLTLYAIPTETLLNELSVKGELPIDWITERVSDFNNAVSNRAASIDEDPVVMASSFKEPTGSDWKAIYIFPINAKGALGALVDRCNQNIERQAWLGMTKCSHAHAGVLCVAFK